VPREQIVSESAHFNHTCLSDCVVLSSLMSAIQVSQTTVKIEICKRIFDLQVLYQGALK